MAADNYLIDTSAMNRVPKDRTIATRIGQYLAAGIGDTCAILDLESLWSARSPADYDEIVKYRNGTLIWTEIDDSAMRRALEVQALLAQKSMHRAVGLPHLIIAAAAETNDLIVLHYDHDFDHVAAVTGQQTEWVAARGTVA